MFGWIASSLAWLGLWSLDIREDVPKITCKSIDWIRAGGPEPKWYTYWTAGWTHADCRHFLGNLPWIAVTMYVWLDWGPYRHYTYHLLRLWRRKTEKDNKPPPIEEPPPYWWIPTRIVQLEGYAAMSLFLYIQSFVKGDNYVLGASVFPYAIAGAELWHTVARGFAINHVYEQMSSLSMTRMLRLVMSHVLTISAVLIVAFHLLGDSVKFRHMNEDKRASYMIHLSSFMVGLGTEACLLVVTRLLHFQWERARKLHVVSSSDPPV